jgi:predicted negative regulator of RcsB-dependent stress response
LWISAAASLVRLKADIFFEGLTVMRKLILAVLGGLAWRWFQKRQRAAGEPRRR